LGNSDTATVKVDAISKMGHILLLGAAFVFLVAMVVLAPVLILSTCLLWLLERKRVPDEKKLWHDGRSVQVLNKSGCPCHIVDRLSISPAHLRTLLHKSAQERRSMRLQRIDGGLYVNMNPPAGTIDALLNPLLPAISRDCFYGDLVEMHNTKILPKFISERGPLMGYFAAERWFRKQIFRSVLQLVWYRVQTLLFTEAAWQPPQFKK